jgi:hypothetical protein
MKLTDFQRSIIASILHGQINNAETFLAVRCPGKRVQAVGTTLLGWRNINHGETGLLLDDGAVAYSQLKQFLSLWRRLESAGLINTVTTASRVGTFEPIFKPSAQPNANEVDRNIMTILQQNADREIQTLPELEDFVEHDYLTIDERDKQAEAIDRRIAQRDTRRIAYWSIGISVVVALSGAIFNWLTYTTERSVIIKNASAFPDTQKVLLVNPSALSVTNVLIVTVGSNDTTTVSVQGIK